MPGKLRGHASFRHLLTLFPPLVQALTSQESRDLNSVPVRTMTLVLFLESVACISLDDNTVNLLILNVFR